MFKYYIENSVEKERLKKGILFRWHPRDSRWETRVPGGSTLCNRKPIRAELRPSIFLIDMFVLRGRKIYNRHESPRRGLQMSMKRRKSHYGGLGLPLRAVLLQESGDPLPACRPCS